MASVPCPSCGTPNRAGAKFCAKCRASLVVAPPRAQPAQSPAVPAAPARAPIAPGVARPSTRGCGAILGDIAHAFSRGRGSAFSEIFSPRPVAEGMIVSAVDTHPVSTPVEFGCLVWTFAWFAMGVLVLLFSFAGWWYNPAMFLMLLPLLFLLAMLGLRRPYFSRLTPTIFFSLLSARGLGKQNQLKFTLRTPSGDVWVTMIGAIKNLSPDATPQQGHVVRMWGIRAGSTMRVWKLQYLNADGSEPTQPFVLTTARLFPLVAALFFPTLFWFVAWFAWLIVTAFVLGRG